MPKHKQSEQEKPKPVKYYTDLTLKITKKGPEDVYQEILAFIESKCRKSPKSNSTNEYIFNCNDGHTIFTKRKEKHNFLIELAAVRDDQWGMYELLYKTERYGSGKPKS